MSSKIKYLNNFFNLKNKQLINQNVFEIIRNFKGNKIILTGCYEPLAVFFKETKN